MMLRNSFGLTEEADVIDRAVDQALEDGFRTGDIAQKKMGIVGTQEMTDAILERLVFSQ